MGLWVRYIDPQDYAGILVLTQSYEKKSQPVRVGILGIGGGMGSRIKRLLKVRNRSAAGCCEPLRTQSKSLPDCRPASWFSSHAGHRE